MFCDEVLELVEPIAAGDHAPDGRIAAHLSTCPNCAAALESARRVERLLAAREQPRVPPQFTSRLMARLRRERWQREQRLDAGFNIAIGATALLLVSVVWVFVQQAGLAAIGRDTLRVITGEVTALSDRLGPSLAMYGGAAGLLAAALGIWWWAERDV